MAIRSMIVPCLIFILAINGIEAATYTVSNNVANTTRFNTEIGCEHATQILEEAATFIWHEIFQQTNPSERKSVQHVALFIDDNMDEVSYTMNDQIHVSARHIESYKGDVRREMEGILYHEATHIWQWDGNGAAPSGLIEGIADYVRLKAGYANGNWVNPGQGSKWDQGYDVTAWFLDYCNGRMNAFVADLNGDMRHGYSDSFFEDLLGESVNELWIDYKAEFSRMD